MEKRIPHCPLRTVRALVDAGNVRATLSALAGGAGIGLDFQAILDVVKSLEPVDFYKSMTTHANHRVWQGVYRPRTKAGDVYLKITVIEDLLIVSFKEL